MPRISKTIFAAMLSIAAAAPAIAEDAALIIANRNYTTLRDVPEALTAFSVSRALRAAGFDVLPIRDLDQDGMAENARLIRDHLADADRVVVFLAGHIGSTDNDSWLMSTDASRDGSLLAGANGLSIRALLDLLEDKAGSATVLVNRRSGAQFLGPDLAYGYSADDIPQGVTVFTGPTRDLTRVVVNGLLVEGATTSAIAEAASDNVSAHGFVSRTVPFIPASPVEDEPAVQQIDPLEALIWTQAKKAGSEAALKIYLSRYPNGRFANEARTLLAQMQKSPEEMAKEAETALALNRDARRDIQRDLSLLGYDTRGIDGIFGGGTRLAVRGWQRSVGQEPTGYLTAAQISALDAAASIRARELEEEARLRQEALERADRSFWRATGAGSSEDGLQAYLKRYPDGLFSEVAEDRLAQIEEDKLASAAAAERSAWNNAVVADTIKGYEAYLATYPGGRFASNAEARIGELNALEENVDEVAKAEAEEMTVLSNPLARTLVETRLRALGFDPGKVDGKFNNNTRKAIRKFQRASNLPVTGFVSQATMVRIMAS